MTSTNVFNENVIFDLDKAIEVLIRHSSRQIMILDSCSISTISSIYESVEDIVDIMNDNLSDGSPYMILRMVFNELSRGSGISAAQIEFINALATEKHKVLIVDEEVGLLILQKYGNSTQNINSEYAVLMNEELPYLPGIEALLKSATDKDLPIDLQQSNGRNGNRCLKVYIRQRKSGDAAKLIGDYVRQRGYKNIGEEMTVVALLLMQWYIGITGIKIMYCSEDTGARSKVEHIISTYKGIYLKSLSVFRSLNLVQQYIDGKQGSSDLLVNATEMCKVISKKNDFTKLLVNQNTVGINANGVIRIDIGYEELAEKMCDKTLSVV